MGFLFYTMPNILTQEQFLEIVYTKSRYSKEELKITGEYKGVRKRILGEVKYGEVLLRINHLLSGHEITIRLATNKTEYFKNWLNDVNKHYRNGEFWLKGEYIGSHKNILVEDNYGLLNPFVSNLLRGHAPNISSAVNPTEYLINQFIEKWGDKFGYDKVVYNGMLANVQIYCKKHKIYFPQTPINHLNSSICCPYCANEARIKYHREKPNGWGWKPWKKKAKKSKYFDSFKVYIIRIWNENEEFFKIGRTFRTLKKRFGNCKGDMPYQYEILWIEEDKKNAKRIFKLECELHRLHKQHKYTPNIKFDGLSECFSFIDEKIVKEKFGGLEKIVLSL